MACQTVGAPAAHNAVSNVTHSPDSRAVSRTPGPTRRSHGPIVDRRRRLPKLRRQASSMSRVVSGFRHASPLPFQPLASTRCRLYATHRCGKYTTCEVGRKDGNERGSESYFLSGRVGWPRRMICTSRPKAAARTLMIGSVGLVRPCSILIRWLRSTPVNAETSTCVMPAFSRAARNCAPNPVSEGRPVVALRRPGLLGDGDFGGRVTSTPG